MANTNEDVVLGLLDNIYSTLMKIDAPGDKVEESSLMISIQNQGRPIISKDYQDAWTPFLENGDVGDDQDPDALPNPDNDSNIRSAYNASELVDKALTKAADGSVGQSTTRISTTWDGIIRGAAPDLSNSQPSEATIQALQDAMDILYYKTEAKVLGKKNPDGSQLYVEVDAKTQEYSAYLACQKDYLKAQENYAKAYQRTFYDPIAKKMWPINGKSMIADVDNAWDAWNTEGYKTIMEQALDTKKSQGSDPTKGMIADAKARFDVYQMALGGAVAKKVPYTYITPSDWCTEDSDIWTQYDSVSKSTETHDYKNSREWTTNVKVNYGLFSASASSNGKYESVDNNSSEEDTQISLKWAVVDINRPWMETSILNWRGWHIVGQPAGCVNTPGLLTYLPTIPTQMVIVKDVIIKNKSIQNSLKTMALNTDSSLKVGYGPFVSGGGTLKTSDEKKDELMDMSRQGLSIPGIQIIGWVSYVTPKNVPSSDGMNA